MQSHFYIHLSSEDSKIYFPANNVNTFTVKLPEVLKLDGQWEVSLCELFYPANNAVKNLFISSNLCIDTIIGDQKRPLLRMVRTKKSGYAEFGQRYYIPVSSDTIDRVTIYINTENETEIPFSSGTFRCTLHIRKNEANKNSTLGSRGI